MYSIALIYQIKIRRGRRETKELLFIFAFFLFETKEGFLVLVAPGTTDESLRVRFPSNSRFDFLFLIFTF